MFFSLEQRPNVKKEHPDYGVGQLSKQLAGDWKLFNQDQKKPYELMAQSHMISHMSCHMNCPMTTTWR